jgi:glycosyltransferase involved in cell wall biosynthesis
MTANRTRRVDVLGPVPPPFGGVSIHILRFGALLAAEGHAARVLPCTGLTRKGRAGRALQAAGQMAALYWRYRRGRGDVLHLHYGGLGYLLALGPLLAATPARRVVTFHSVRVVQDLERADAARRRRALDLLGRFDLFVAVRAEIGEALRGLGLDGPAVTVMPAFLPPAAAEADLARLPAAARATLGAALAAGRRQLCCGAYYLGEGYGHDDVYGVEALAAALEALDAQAGPPADLWVFVSNAPDTAARRRIDRDLRERAARWRRFGLHLNYGLPMIPVLARSSGLLRPSREDGDSVAVREALALGVSVLASDAVARPEGVCTYPLAAPDGLPAALGPFLAGLPASNKEAAAVRIADPDRYSRFVAEVVGI